jgi:hypothetical protein
VDALHLGRVGLGEPAGELGRRRLSDGETDREPSDRRRRGRGAQPVEVVGRRFRTDPSASSPHRPVRVRGRTSGSELGPDRRQRDHPVVRSRRHQHPVEGDPRPATPEVGLVRRMGASSAGWCVAPGPSLTSPR